MDRRPIFFIVQFLILKYLKLKSLKAWIGIKVNLTTNWDWLTLLDNWLGQSSN